jgi:uroporphyrinogen decarboxylase
MKKGRAAQANKPARVAPASQGVSEMADAPQPALLAALAGNTVMQPPIWLMLQAGRYLPEYRETRARAGSFLDLCYNPRLAAEATLQPIRRFGFDAAIIFSDILVIPHALGQPVWFVEGEGPRLDPINSAEGLALLENGKTGDRFALVYEAIERTVTELGRETPLIGFCGAPWTVATYMIGGGGSPDQRAAKLMAFGDRSAFAALIALLVEASAAYLIGQVKAGARALQIFDSWAGSLADSDFEDWVIAPTAEIVRRVKTAYPDVPVIGFPRGGAAHYARYVETTGIQGLGCDTSAPLAAMAAMQQRIPVQGNLDPILLLAGGDAMERRALAILDALAGNPFIFNLGHGILPETPIAHVQRLIEIVRG